MNHQRIVIIQYNDNHKLFMIIIIRLERNNPGLNTFGFSNSKFGGAMVHASCIIEMFLMEMSFEDCRLQSIFYLI